MKLGKFSGLLGAALLATAFSAGAQQMYRWIDKDGKVRYGDQPPPGAKASVVKPPPGPASQPGTAPAKETAEQAFQKRRQEARKQEEKDAGKRTEVAEARANCESARGSLVQLESGQRIAKVGPDGERAFIDDDQRAADIVRARKNVEQWCK